MRAFFGLLPAGSLVVIDNFHEPPAEAAWRLAFAEGLRELPADINLLFISRIPPPPEMARMVADQTITQIAWDALRFTQDEAVEMIAGNKLSPELARQMHRASDGWAAGDVLIREHLCRAGGPAGDTLLPDGMDALFE
jgi:ATP/maltotriose-dependent transcriptional regulator MalT